MIKIINMRKPRNRRLHRSKRIHDKKVYKKSANIIQKCCRKFLKNRYNGICRNYNDYDIFTFEPVYLIPKELLIVIEGHGFNSLSLLKWIMRKESQVHPITRNILSEECEVTAICKIAIFLRRDSENFRCKKGYFKRRGQPNKVLTSYAKNKLNLN